MNTELSKEIIGIKAINLLFFNYTNDMLEEMKTIREFNHCWENYVNLEEQTYMQIWELYLTKISYKGQISLLEIALKYFGEEATEGFEYAIKVDGFLQAHIAKHTSKNK
ncbi:hypothetical protein [Chryseobacterium oncorhynchi]|uniref:Uncharacterized protein n=1 Tax=Chryseobacterium oncorhynchi TaxID=741074 RepID=A0A316WD53_9FLAO|nr:hypothetical protein [Chryseobacterium oncorhynchi]PWN59227.1 hypothetical protein C1638_021710 [Chryseobacterium oncorhynchi]